MTIPGNALPSLRMTEAGWWASSNPYDLLTHMEAQGQAAPRKLRLFACAVAARFGGGEAVKVCERYADGLAGEEELGTARAKSEQGWRRSRGGHGWTWHSRRIRPAGRVARVEWEAAQPLAWDAALGAARESIHDLRQEQCRFLRELLGNPFRPIDVRGAWLAWEGGTVRGLAQAIYEERAFDRLPVLADALTDAGCDEVALLAHFREAGEHLVGCWGLDLLVGRS